MLLLLVVLGGCKQILGIDEGSVAKDASMVDDVAVIDTPIDVATCKDDDGDTVCNAIDTWPCGPEPGDLPTTVTWDHIENGNHITISLTGAKLNNVPKLVAAPGETVKLSTQYSIIDCVCPACLDQIEVGFSGAGRQGCVYHGNPSGSTAATCMTPATGMTERDLVAPALPGVYTVRFGLGQGFECTSDETSWWLGSEPPASSSVAYLWSRSSAS